MPAWLMLPAGLGWLAGVAGQLQWAQLPGWGMHGAVLAGGVALMSVAWRLPQHKGAAWGVLRWQVLRWVMAFGAAALLAWSTTGLRALTYDQSRLNPELEGADLLVTGVVASMPQRNEAGQRFRFEVESARRVGQGAEAVLPPRIQVSWYAAAYFAAGWNTPALSSANAQPRVQAGDRWQFTLRPKAPHGGLNPHGFDYELWLWEQDLQAVASVRDGPRAAAPQRIGSTWGHPVERARQAVRDAILDRLAVPLPAADAESNPRRWAGIVAALVTGDQNAIDRADWDVFRATGVAHLMSISGLHITMFAWMAVAAVGWLWRRSARLCLWQPAPQVALVAGVGLAAAYALFSGWGVPAQRTVLMLATVGLLRLSGRRWPWPLVWLLAAVVVVVADPWALLQAGFWLSFVAVGVLFASDTGQGRQGEQQRRDADALHGLEPAAPPDSAARQMLSSGTAKLIALLREQGLITLALAPLTLLLFGQVSVVGLLANLLAIPWVTLVVTPLAMGGVLLPPLWDGAGWAVQGLALVLQAMAAWPWATWQIAQPPLWLAVAAIVGGVWLVLPLPWGLRGLGLPLLLPLLIWQPSRPAQGEFTLLAADIGQGTAVLVQTAHHALLYDAGPRYSKESDAGHRVVAPLLRALGVQLDTLVLSHRDTDHTGGAPAVLAMQPQAALLSSIEDDHALQALRPAQRCHAGTGGQRWQWDGVDFEILHPQASDYDSPRKSNAMSCVLKITAGRQSALLTGDIEREQEQQLTAAAADKPETLRATVLLVPHHGSKTSSSEAFLDAVQPQIALIQNGYRNRFGHPVPEVLERYKARQIRVFDSPHCGAAQWSSAAPEVVTCERERRGRYWHHWVP